MAIVRLPMITMIDRNNKTLDTIMGCKSTSLMRYFGVGAA
jgi:hypothetical protein